ncbi:MAG: tRNA-binding protein [Salibacteraceae bacterium]
MIKWNDFIKVEIRVGTVLEVLEFPEAHNPSYKLKVDFGSHGILKSSAQITRLYALDELVGQQVLGVINLPEKQIGPFMSECLILGIATEPGEVILLQPERKAPNGYRVS